MSITILIAGHFLGGCGTGRISGEPGGDTMPDASSTADGRPGDPIADARPGAPDARAADTATIVWVGTGAYDASAEGRVAPFVLAGGGLTAGASLAVGSLPSWIALAPGGAVAYALDENRSEIRAYAVAPGTGALTPIGGATASGGTGPVHMVVDHTGRWLLVAHYTSGNVAVLPIGASGAISGPPSDVEETGGFTHQVVIDPSNRFVLVPCVAANHVAQLVFDAERGTLSRNTPPAVASASGAGPRHLALHPDGAHAYVVDELGSTVTAYAYDAARGTLTRQASVSTLPDDFTGDNTGGEIAIAGDGRVVYASNRGHDSIAVLTVGSGGAVTLTSHAETGGAVPRSMSLSPDGTRLLVANQESNQLVSFAVGAGGELTRSGGVVDTGARAFFVGAFVIPRP